MYIYQVTNLTTGQFYIAGTTDSKKTFDPTKQVDPYDQFVSKLPAGSSIYRCVEKRMLTPVSDMDQLSTSLNQYSIQFGENPKFLGVLGSVRSDNFTRRRPKPDPIDTVTTEPVVQKSEPVKHLKNKFDTTVSDS